MMISPAPKKSLGQHFLINDSVSRRIADILNIEPVDNIIEIGPGPGALTKYIKSSTAQNILLLEKDKYWARYQAQTASTKTSVFLIDALTMAWERLGDLGGWKIAGNLPYNVASPLIWDIISKCDAWKAAVFMVQKEVAERICAEPGSKNYGALSVWTQCYSIPKLEFHVSRGSFRPAPKVDSSVVSFAPRPQQHKDFSPDALKRLLKICFQKRRKQLRNIFASSNLPDMALKLARLGIDAQLRPENLSCEDFINLSL